MQVTIHEAETQLSKLIAAAERGEEVIIFRRDKPVVRLTMVEGFSGKTRIGGLKGRKLKQKDCPKTKGKQKDCPVVVRDAAES